MACGVPPPLHACWLPQALGNARQPWRTFSSKLVLFFHSPAGGINDPMKEKGFDIRFSSNNRVTPWVTSGLSLSP